MRLRSLETGHETVVQAPYVLDATELGDLLPLAGVEYVSGAESQAETGEPHAVEGPAQPDNVQGLTWCFPWPGTTRRGPTTPSSGRRSTPAGGTTPPASGLASAPGRGSCWTGRTPIR